MGHKRLVLTHLAESSTIKSEKADLVKKVLEVAGKAIALAEMEFSSDKGLRALLNMHLADGLISYSEHSSGENKDDVLLNALELVTKSIDHLGGSVAHKAWGLNKKAQIHHLFGETKEAFEALEKAERSIFHGFDEETKSEKDGLMKIKIWLTGIWLTHAKIAIDQNKSELAKIYANAVIGIPDDDKTLTLRKNQAERILSETNN